MTRCTRAKGAALLLAATLTISSINSVSADAASWQTLEAGSITFVAVQAGAPFEGRFERFEADIRFAPDALEDSAFLVKIELVSVMTDYADRDEILRGPEFFDVQAQPLAVYEADRFTALGNSEYRADGSLSINGKQIQTAVKFTFFPEDDEGAVQILDGTAEINRLDFDLGLGDWRDPKWVGHTVSVHFRLRLRVFPDFATAGEQRIMPVAE